jgi:hypothetical protein
MNLSRSNARITSDKEIGIVVRNPRKGLRRLLHICFEVGPSAASLGRVMVAPVFLHVLLELGLVLVYVWLHHLDKGPSHIIAIVRQDTDLLPISEQCVVSLSIILIQELCYFFSIEHYCLRAGRAHTHRYMLGSGLYSLHPSG